MRFSILTLFITSSFIGTGAGYTDFPRYLSFTEEKFTINSTGTRSPSSSLYVYFYGDWMDTQMTFYTDALSGLSNSKYIASLKSGLGLSGFRTQVLKTAYIPSNPLTRLVVPVGMNSVEVLVRNAVNLFGFDDNGIYVVIVDSQTGNKNLADSSGKAFDKDWCVKSGALFRSGNGRYVITSVSDPSSFKGSTKCTFNSGIVQSAPYVGINDDMILPGSDYSLAVLIQAILSEMLAPLNGWGGRMGWTSSTGAPLPMACTNPGNSVKVFNSADLFNARIKGNRYFLFALPKKDGTCGNHGTVFEYLSDACKPDDEPSYGVYAQRKSIKC